MRNERHSIAPYLAVLFVLQCLAVLFTLLLSSEPTLTEIVICTVAPLAAALLDVWVATRTSKTLRACEAAYEADVARDLQTSLEEYRSASRDDRTLTQQIGTRVEGELAWAREALVSGEPNKAQQHLSVGLEIASQAHAPICENAIVAAVLSSKARQCSTAGVALQPEVRLPASLPIGNTELASLFFNLIDNALHECEALLEEESTHQEPTICVRSFVQAGQLYIEVANPCRPGAERRRRAALLNADSTMFHGLGSGIVAEIAHSKGGLTEHEEHHGRFVVRVMIPLPDDSVKAA